MHARYARVLVVGSSHGSEASLIVRTERALGAFGHATYLIDPAADADGAAIRAAADGFRPSVVVMDVRSCRRFPEAQRAIAELRVPVMALRPNDTARASALGSCDAPLPALLPRAARDGAYARATTSRPVEAREARILVMQPADDRTQRLVEALRASATADVALADPSWGPDAADTALCAGAFLARTCRICALFDAADPADAPCAADAALRVAEGCVVLAERSLLARWGDESLAACAVAFDEESLAATAARLLSDDNAWSQAREAQAAWLAGLPELAQAAQEALEALDAAVAGDASVEAAAPFPANSTAEPAAAAADPTTGSESLPAEHAANHRRALVSEEPARRIAVFGWLGARNFGDDLLLSVVMRRVRDRFPFAQFTVIGASALQAQRQYGVEAVTADDPYRIREAVQRADAVVFCGGLVFDDPMSTTAGDVDVFMEPYINPACQAETCLMAWQAGVPALYLGAGIGPLAKPAARHSLRLAGLAGARFLLRDAESAALAIDAGVPASQVGVCADLAFSARPVIEAHAASPLPDGLERGGYFIVSLRDWPLNPEGFAETLARAIDRAVRETGLTAAFVPFDSDDARIHADVASRMAEASRAVALPQTPDASGMFALIEGSAFAFAMRLHCSILHHVMGKPAVGLDYNEKIGSHYKVMEQLARLLPLGASADEMADALAETHAAQDEIGREVAARAAQLESEALRAFEELFAAVEQHAAATQPDEPECYHPRAISQARVELREAHARTEALERQLAEANARADHAEQRARDLEASTSFRVGHALMRIPHAIFRRG